MNLPALLLSVLLQLIPHAATLPFEESPLSRRQINSIGNGPKDLDPNGDKNADPTKIAIVLCSVIGFLSITGGTLVVRYILVKRRLRLQSIRQTKGKFPAQDDDDDNMVYITSNRLEDYPSPLETSEAIRAAYEASLKEDLTLEQQEQPPSTKDKILTALGVKKSGGSLKNDLGKILPPHLVDDELDLSSSYSGSEDEEYTGYPGGGGFAGYDPYASQGRSRGRRSRSFGSVASQGQKRRRSATPRRKGSGRRRRSASSSGRSGSKRNSRLSRGSVGSFGYRDASKSSSRRRSSRPGSVVSQTSSFNLFSGGNGGAVGEDANATALKRFVYLITHGMYPPENVKQRRREQPPLNSLPPRGAGGSSRWKPPAPAGARFPVTIPHVPLMDLEEMVRLREVRGLDVWRGVHGGGGGAGGGRSGRESWGSASGAGAGGVVRGRRSGLFGAFEEERRESGERGEDAGMMLSSASTTGDVVLMIPVVAHEGLGGVPGGSSSSSSGGSNYGVEKGGAGSSGAAGSGSGPGSGSGAAPGWKKPHSVASVKDSPTTTPFSHLIPLSGDDDVEDGLDELPLRVGDAVVVYEWREDGWCFGRREDGEGRSAGEERGPDVGWFPIVCVMPKDERVRRRVEGVSGDEARGWVRQRERERESGGAGGAAVRVGEGKKGGSGGVGGSAGGASKGKSREEEDLERAVRESLRDLEEGAGGDGEEGKTKKKKKKGGKGKGKK
ncbi:hypothetical protein HDU97_010003 [Phlyctochytrium planicorne]|nr:hypothetical protein HDU97_010003 [Phlyctochytrium planicorne]